MSYTKWLLLFLSAFSFGCSTSDLKEDEKLSCECETIETLVVFRTIYGEEAIKVREEVLSVTPDPNPDCGNPAKVTSESEVIHHADAQPPYVVEYLTIREYNCNTDPGR